MAARTLSHYSVENKHTDSFLYVFNKWVSKKTVGVPVVSQSHPAEEGCGGQIMSIYCN